jgi:hypothetical protein
LPFGAARLATENRTLHVLLPAVPFVQHGAAMTQPRDRNTPLAIAAVGTATAKQPPTFGPIVVTKSLMLTAKEFFARQKGRRGTRTDLDEALSWALWADDSDLAPMVRARFDAYRALVLKALACDPLGIIEASPEVKEACHWRSEIGKTARTQAETMRHAEVETASRVKAEKERAEAEKEAARVEAEKKARDLTAARDEAKKAAAIAESERARAESERARADAERAAARAESERATQAEADRVAQVRAWGSEGGGKRAELTERGVKNLKAFWAEQSFDLDNYKPNDTGNKTKIDETAKKLKVSKGTVQRYLRVIFPERTRKRQPRPRSSAVSK